MGANLNIFIRPVEMYLMMASVCPSVSSPTDVAASTGMNVKRKPVSGGVRWGMEEALQTPWFVPRPGGWRMKLPDVWSLAQAPEYNDC